MSSFCYPITVPPNDPYNTKLGIECLNFVRTVTDVDMNCDESVPKEYADQLTIVTPFIDLCNIYGPNVEWSNQLRSFKRGHLRTDYRNGQEWLPAAVDKHDKCDIDDPEEICYFGGDLGVNQNIGIVLLTTILVREHNRLADGLRKINSHWSDERLFQEARRINIAQTQAITYYDWLPILLGKTLKNNNIYYTLYLVYINLRQSKPYTLRYYLRKP